MKKLPIKTITIGHYHCILSKEYMGHQHSNSEWISNIKPDYIACIGNISKDILIKQGVPPNKLIAGANLRQSKQTENFSEKTKQKYQFLIADFYLEMESGKELDYINLF